MGLNFERIILVIKTGRRSVFDGPKASTVGEIFARYWKDMTVIFLGKDLDHISS